MSTIRIAVVASEMEGEPTGVGTYLEGLLSGLAGAGAGAEGYRFLLIFRGEPFEHPLWAAGSTASGASFEPIFDRRPGGGATLWEQLRLPRLLARARPDLVFSPNYSLPGGWRRPSLVALHDLSFEHLGGELGFRERWRRRWLARRAARRATRLVVGTEAMARDLEVTYGVGRERIGVVPLAVAERFRPTRPGDEEPDRAHLASLGIEEPYLLFVGSLFERRRPEVMVQAFGEVADSVPGLRLVLAGHDRLRRPETLGDAITVACLGERVLHLGYVPEAALSALYRRARLLLYLSTYEGYGLPPLEALASGSAAVVSPGQALDDLWPEYPYRCPAGDREALAGVLRRALGREEERRTVAAAGPERVGRLDWERSSRLLLRQIGAALGRGEAP